MSALGNAAEWFRRETGYLLKTANLLERAADRLTIVVERREAAGARA
jgi:hypothetical protein